MKQLSSNFVFNSVEIICYYGLKNNLLDKISSSKYLIDFNKIFPLNIKNEHQMLSIWKQPFQPTLKNIFIKNMSICCSCISYNDSILNILKQVSLYPEVQEIILSFTSINTFNNDSGIFYIRTGGVMDKYIYRKNTLENKKFSLKLLSQIDTPKLRNTI